MVTIHGINRDDEFIWSVDAGSVRYRKCVVRGYGPETNDQQEFPTLEHAMDRCACCDKPRRWHGTRRKPSPWWKFWAGSEQTKDPRTCGQFE